jgi:hypothetical protein
MRTFTLWLENRQPFVYHVTFYKNLDLISDEGLDYKEYGGANFSQGVYPIHSMSGNFFTTDINRIGFWIHSLEYSGLDQSDNIEEDGLVPIILRFRLNPKKYQPDIHGGDPSDHFTDRLIPPQGLQVWNGKQWIPINYWNNINLNDFVDRDEYGVSVKDRYPMPKQ